MKKTALFSVAMLVSAMTFADTWNSDVNHSRLGFGITHLSISEVDGSFKSFKTTVTSSGADFDGATIELSADIDSINTDVAARDTALKSDEFFDAKTNPKLTFKSKACKKTDDKHYQVSGDLTMHGITKPVVLDAVLNGTVVNPMSKKLTAGFRVTGTVKRKDYDLGAKFPEAALSDEVKLLINLELQKAESK